MINSKLGNQIIRRLVPIFIGILCVSAVNLSAEPPKENPKPTSPASGGKDEEPKELTPRETFQKCVDTYYDFAKQGVTRYACYIKMPEVAKAQQYRTKYILTAVDYELIWEKDKPVQVKTRDIPSYFGNEAKAEAGLYAALMESAFKEFAKVTQPTQNIFTLPYEIDKGKVELSATPDGKLTRLDFTPKPKKNGKTADGAKPRQEADKDKEKINEDKPEDFDRLSVWLNKDYQVTKVEITAKKEKLVILVTPMKFGKTWNIEKLDITHKNDKDEFLDRLTVVYTYDYPKNIMLPANICLTALDKDGRQLDRRNEVNPQNYQFTKYELEINKESK